MHGRGYAAFARTSWYTVCMNGKKVAIAGFGVEGRSAWRYFRERGAQLTILDEQKPAAVPEGTDIVVGADAFEKADGFDLVVRTPSIRPDRIKTDGEITSTIKEFFKVCPAPIIGVTASKGKGTMSTMIAAMLEASGVRVHLGGNIGIPVLDMLPEITAESVVVLELSSFQLWDLTQSPHVAVVGMIEPDHLDVHKDFAEYVAAKANIAKWQIADDVVVYHPINEESAKIAELSAGKKIRYETPEGAHIEDDWIVMDGTRICELADVRVPGRHNLENICAAVTAVWQFAQDAGQIAEAIRNYKGLEHRLELVRELDGVRYYDDSFSSAPTSAVVAAQAFEEPKVMVLGGYDRHIDLKPMVEAIVKTNVKQVLLIGQTGQALSEHFKQLGLGDKVLFLGTPTMEEIVGQAHGAAVAGDVVLFSPGCPSFDMFANFKERGEQFRKAVEAL